MVCYQKAQENHSSAQQHRAGASVAHAGKGQPEKGLRAGTLEHAGLWKHRWLTRSTFKHEHEIWKPIADAHYHAKEEIPRVSMRGCLGVPKGTGRDRDCMGTDPGPGSYGLCAPSTPHYCSVPLVFHSQNGKTMPTLQSA